MEIKREHNYKGEHLYTSPYNQLHIYYIQGRVNPSVKWFGDSFIGNWEEDNFSFLFFSNPSHDTVERLLQGQPELILLDQFQMSYEEWQGGRITPFSVGSFHIIPPWEKKTESQDRKSEIEILLDPGVVFGTGMHPTTYDCLEMVELVCSENKIESALDLGTGTGLLALAAAKMGCRRALGIDINFLAAKTAIRNVALNQLKNNIHIIQGKAEDFINCPAELVIANIHYDVMKHVIVSKDFLKKKWFILSGLLRTEARDIAYKLSQFPVNILEKRERDGIWHTFFGSINL